MLSITLQQPYGSDNTPMIRAMQKGMYTPLCAPEKYESADYLFEDIEGVQLSEWDSGPKIKMTLNNRARGNKNVIEFDIEKSPGISDANTIRQVCDFLKEKAKK